MKAGLVLGIMLAGVLYTAVSFAGYSPPSAPRPPSEPSAGPRPAMFPKLHELSTRRLTNAGIAALDVELPDDGAMLANESGNTHRLEPLDPAIEAESNLVLELARSLGRASIVVGAAAAAAAAAAAVAVAALLAAAGPESARAVCGIAVEYWRALRHFERGGTVKQCPHFLKDEAARVYIRSLALTLELWDRPHYRNGSFGDDARINLRNVALPGTGVSLSAITVLGRAGVRAAFYVLYPLVALVVALRASAGAKGGGGDTVARHFAKVCTAPTDWFSLWRLNCRLASYAAFATGDPGFEVEDKMTFLERGAELGVPVSPVLKIPRLVCKNRNEEGGMGIHFFQNALNGGDWIVQKALDNAPFVAALLPDKAPLSTIRVVTGAPARAGAAVPPPVRSLAAVFRAGRADAVTDHDAILFDVDMATGVIRKGTVNKDWYQLGWQHARWGPAAAAPTYTHHPDNGAAVTGKTIPDMPRLLAMVEDAHARMCPGVPLCGWDIALTTEGVCLLEVNLSCNFFQAAVDHPAYFSFVAQHFDALDRKAAFA